MESDPTLTPEQQNLRRQAVRPQSIALVAVGVVWLTAPLGALWDTRFYWAAAASALVLLVAVARLISILRSLRRSGPPFQHLRWWWPMRT